jgi:hypothetical protein
MSLKTFHLFFMTSAALCMGFSAFWGGRRLAAGSPQIPFLAVSAVGLLLCLAYLRWFLLRYRTLR